LPKNLRRLRSTESLRRMVRETHVSIDDLIYPIFVGEGLSTPEPIESMPGISRLPLTSVAAEAREIEKLGIRAVLVFGVPSDKDDVATSALRSEGVVQSAIAIIKKAASSLVVITDVCVCAYMTHGHCGVVRGGRVDNEETLPILAEMALTHAQAGADIVAPSSMMDKQVHALREKLNGSGFQEVGIMAYSSKFASAFYGPFREAADSAPSFGDRSSYQHDFANPRHAKRELRHDEDEGADILMVKPGLAYLDIVKLAREISDLPIAAYSVSGEYSMIKAAAERGWLDEKKIVLETLTAFKRAGADLIITYFAKETAKWLNDF
jgi:porphobilinogen synthase